MEKELISVNLNRIAMLEYTNLQHMAIKHLQYAGKAFRSHKNTIKTT